MNYIDIKVTIWNRIHFDDGSDMQKVIEVIENDGIESVYDEHLGFRECEPLYETEENMSLPENGADPTIEVYEAEELIWENANRSLFKA